MTPEELEVVRARRDAAKRLNSVDGITSRDPSWEDIDELLELVDQSQHESSEWRFEAERLREQVRTLELQIGRHRPKPLLCDGCSEERTEMTGRSVHPKNEDLYRDNERILCSVCLSNRSRT